MEKSREKFCPGGPTADRSLNAHLGDRAAAVDRWTGRRKFWGAQAPRVLSLEDFGQLFPVSDCCLGWVSPKSFSGFLDLPSQDSWSFLILPLTTDFSFG